MYTFIVSDEITSMFFKASQVKIWGCQPWLGVLSGLVKTICLDGVTASTEAKPWLYVSQPWRATKCWAEIFHETTISCVNQYLRQ